MPAKTITVNDVKTVLASEGLDQQAKIQTLRGSEGERIRAQVGSLPTDRQISIQSKLAAKAGIDSQQVSLNSVGPSWGKSITHKAIRALIYFFIAITLYISLRFEWKMAVGAIAAVIHDIGISIGIYSIFGFTVTPATVIAFLTILGYSLYDTIVVFDKVHENTRRLSGSGRATYGDIVNLSMNQVLMRSSNTCLAAILPVSSLLVVGSWLLGATALEDFAVALLVGLLTGAYSSIAIATPILAALKEREPRYRQLRAKLGRTTGVAAVAAQAEESRFERPRGAAKAASNSAAARARSTPVPRAATATATDDAPVGTAEAEPLEGNDADAERSDTESKRPASPAASAAPSATAVRHRPPVSGLGHPPRPRKKTGKKR